MIWRYLSVLGQMGNLEIDLNFMYRVPLWPIDFKSSCLVGDKQIHNIPVLDIHELSAGKLTALIDRKTGRDIFDAFYLLKREDKLISNDEILIANIKNHPAVRWSAQQAI